MKPDLAEAINHAAGRPESAAPRRRSLAEQLRGRKSDILLAATIVVADQVTKLLVLAFLDLHESVRVIPGTLDLTYVQNTGAAFGFLNAAEFPYKPLVITVMALAALLAIGAYALQIDDREHFARCGLALILGGAVGNLIDRATRGYVVDFVDAYWREYHFWAFNVADAAITVGAALVILEMTGLFRHAPKAV